MSERTNCTHEPIALVGIGCRLPGGVSSPEAYWGLLARGEDALVDIPENRWSAHRFYDPDLGAGKGRVLRGGFLHQPVDEFDAGFFGISPREAHHMDPQQRLLLEVAWESLEDAGCSLASLAGSTTGVFVGGFTLDYSQLQFAAGRTGRRNLQAHTATGVVMTMLANRLSHAFDLLGPSMAVDTACSSSLVATHLACQAIWRGECTAALAGGVNLMLTPNFTIAASQGGFLSPTSSSHPFDARANGYVRSEGAAMVLLKPLSAAQANGDRVYAVIRGTAVSQDGRTNGITVPNGTSQKAAMLRALEQSGLPAHDIGYVEAHGTGTPVGDPIEARAIGEVYGRASGRSAPVLMSSVKANLGHLEAAAGVTGLVKVALTLHHGQVPPHPDLRTVNPAIDLDGLGVHIPTALEPLAIQGRRPAAAVNSFGFGGTNAHVVLEAPPAGTTTEPRRSLPARHGLPRIVPLTARGQQPLRDLAGAYADLLADGLPSASVVAGLCHRRTHHVQHRLAVVTDEDAQLCQAFRNVAEGSDHPAALLGEASGERPRVAFVYTGMGPQWWGMGRDLLESSPVFRAAVQECDDLLRPLAGWSVIGELLRDQAHSRMHRAAVSQPANFALQVGLTALWRSLGVTPDAIVGHSAGEPAAAFAAGALTLHEAVTVIYHRARLQDTLHGTGRLAAVGISEAEAAALPWVADGRLCVAAVNAPTSIALVGAQSDLEELQAGLESSGVFCRLVDGAVPYHSPAMDSIHDELLACLAGLAPSVPSVPLYSTVTGGPVTEATHDARYWWRNVRRPVRFADAAAALVETDLTAFVEVGPNPVLASAVRDALTTAGRQGLVVASLKRKGVDRRTVADACAQLYVAGVDIDFGAFAAPEPVGTVPLPRYPWDRRRHWTEADDSRDDRLGTAHHPLLGQAADTGGHWWTRTLDRTLPRYLDDHRVMDSVLFPGAGFAELAWAAARAAFGTDTCALESLTFDRPVGLNRDADYEVHTVLDAETAEVTVLGRAGGSDDWTTHSTARIVAAPAGAPALDLTAVRQRCRSAWSADDAYASFAAAGFDYGPGFRLLAELWRDRTDDGTEVVARLVPDAAHRHADDGYVLDPALLDGCFQLLLPFLPRTGRGSLLPTGADRIAVHARPHGALWAHARATSATAEELAGDVVLTDATGRVFVEVRGFRVRRLPAAGAPRQGDHWLHQLTWEPAVPDVAELRQPRPGSTYLLLAERQDDAATLAGHLTAAGYRTELLLSPASRAGTASRLVGHAVDFGDAAALRTALSALATRPDLLVEGVVDLRPLAAPAPAEPDDVPAAAEAQAFALLGLVQALEELELPWPLTLVTCGAQAVDEPVGLAGLVQSPVWGMGRVLHQESLALASRLVDLDPARPAADAGLLATELQLASLEEEQVAYRDGRRLLARLQPTPSPMPSVPVRPRPDGAYLITGGLGSLGLVFAQWLADRGARHLVLTSRTGLPERRTWSTLPDGPQRRTIEAIARIERAGATVDVAPLDISSTKRVTDFLADRKASGHPPIRGVIHSAGAVADQILTRMTPQQLRDVLTPKIQGSWALHNAFDGADLDFFALFSSVGSVVVTYGQGNYAAGNAFLDTLAHYRRSRGLPAVAINWGPWDIGMIADLELEEYYTRRGMDLVPPAVGLRLGGEILGSASTQQVVLSAHWPTVVASYQIVPRLIQHLARTEESTDGDSAVDVLERLHAASSEDRLGIAEDACAEIAAAVLRIPITDLPRDRALNQLGLDSMIAVEVRIRLEKVFGVAPKVVFMLQGATVRSVAAFIEAEIVVADAPGQLEDLAETIDDDTLEALLREVEVQP